uniref:Nucleoporin 62 C-terminal like n=1 Tax=Propithecus coquereli TaxID=379532 RepID=A0A2K6FHW0_PROCO
MLFPSISNASTSTTATGPSSTTSTTTTTTVTTTTTTTVTSGFILNPNPLTSTGISNTELLTSTVNAIVTPVMTYGHLESLTNKWSLELQEQENYFLHEVTKINAWDRALMENGEKITILHREVEKVKLDQKRLEGELDFILSQQKELEDLLTTLEEESVKDQSGLVYLQHADMEREKTFSRSAKF